MITNKFTVQIGDWESGEIHSVSGNHTLDSAKEMLWACANQAIPEYAQADIGDYRTPIGNKHLRGKPAHSDQEKALVDKLNDNSISAIVGDALNQVYDVLKHYGDNPRYIELVTKAAEDWAKECYQCPEIH